MALSTFGDHVLAFFPPFFLFFGWGGWGISSRKSLCAVSWNAMTFNELNGTSRLLHPAVWWLIHVYLQAKLGGRMGGGGGPWVVTITWLKKGGKKEDSKGQRTKWGGGRWVAVLNEVKHHFRWHFHVSQFHVFFFLIKGGSSLKIQWGIKGISLLYETWKHPFSHSSLAHQCLPNKAAIFLLWISTPTLPVVQREDQNLSAVVRHQWDLSLWQQPAERGDCTSVAGV